jgi:hypothetical protein
MWGRISLSIILCFFLLGCGAASIDKSANLYKSEESLTPGSIYLRPPSEFNQAAGAAAKTLIVIEQIFNANRQSYVLAPRDESLDDSLRIARDRGLAFVLEAQIVLWDDVITGWEPQAARGAARQLDLGEFKFTLYDAASGKMLRQDILGGEGTGASFNAIPLSQHGPEDCLRKPLENWLATLFS